MTTQAQTDMTALEQRVALPAGVTIDQCEITTYADLCDRHDTIGDEQANIEETSPAIILPGWVADDGLGDAEDYMPDVESAEAAASAYANVGDYLEPLEHTAWEHVHTWRTGYTLDEDGDVVRLAVDEDEHTIAIDPEEPDCTDEDGHDWRSPHEVIGGIEDNPGVWQHAGGVIIREVCAHCGCYRVTDTWATDPATGEQGLESIRYEDADARSLAWVESLDEE